MSIKAKCGHCQAGFSVRDEFAGKQVKCPKCSRPMRIPGRQEAQEKTVQAAPSAVALGRSAGLSPVLPHEVAPATLPRPAGNATPNSAVNAKPAAAKTTPSPMFAGAAGVTNDAGKATRSSAGNASSNYYNPLLDLLNEAQVAARPRGAGCPNCGAEVQPNAIICVECGYNLETGEQLETAILVDDNELPGSDKMSDAEKILAKAEKEILERPVTAVGQDFGDGSESFLISLVAVAAFIGFVGLGVATVLSLDWFMDRFKLTASSISITAAVTIYSLGCIWITIMAFTSHPGHGIGCLLSGGLYCIIYGFMQGKGTVVPAIIMIAALLIGLATYALSGPDQPDYSWVPILRNWFAA